MCFLRALVEPGHFLHGDLVNISLNLLFFFLGLTRLFFHSRFLEHFPNKSPALESFPHALLLEESPPRWSALPTLQ